VYYGRMLDAVREEAQVDLSLLKRVVRRGDCVVDAGASIGLYTKFLSALVGPEGLVYSVEPVPETYDVLVSNVRRLGLSNVRPLNYALSDTDGTLEMELPRWSYGGENFYEARVAGMPDEEALRRLREGIPLDGRRTLPAEATLLNARRGNAGGRDGVIQITIREGRNRQVRRMCEAVGHPVRELTRTRIGPLSDRRLKPGMWRDLSAGEVTTLQALAARPAPTPPPRRARPRAARPRSASAR